MRHHRLHRFCLATLLAWSLSISSQAANLTRTSAFEYDPATGLLTKEIVEPGDPNLCLVTAYTYDAYGNKTSATARNCNGSSSEAAAPVGDAVFASRVTSNAYDARGQFPVTSSNALNQSETKTYDARFGAALTLTGPNGLTTSWQYDSFGRKLREIRADGTQTQWQYLYCQGVNGGAAACPANGAYLVQETPLAADGVSANGPWRKTYFDVLDREIRSETLGFDGTSSIVKSTEYDSLGRLYRTSRPYYSGQSPQWTSSAYDSLGRVVSQTYPDNTQSLFSYSGLSATATNALNQSQTRVRNSQGQTVQVIDALNNSLTYLYDPFGNLTGTLDALGNTTVLFYDLRGRKTGMSDPDMGPWSYFYNALGELIRQVDAKGQVTTLAYDKLGRLTSRAEPDLVSTWSYDTCAKGIGKLCAAGADNGYLRSHGYDGLGRPASSTTTLDAAYTASLAYDANGRMATQTWPTGFAVKYVYTALGYLAEVRDNATNALYWQANTLDAEGHLLTQTYGNGVQTQQTYQAATGRLSGILSGAGNGVQNLAYAYDSLGGVTSRQDATQNLVETFLYDALNRLTSSTVNSSGAGLVTKTYAYNAIGNITSRSDVGSYTYGGLNNRPHAVLQVAGNVNAAYAYDANGNLTSGAGRTEVYTSFNRPAALGAAGISEAYAYGPEHQRVRMVGMGATTIYLNPGNNGELLYEKDIRPDASLEHRHFITAGGQVVAVVKLVQTGPTTSFSVRYLHRDALGSTAVVTDEKGSVVERLAYEPFGKRHYTSGADDPGNTIHGLTTTRGFTNHEHLEALGLIHMNGRIYDPVIGRFMSADPSIPDPSNLQAFNRYSYVLNNPLVYTDPSGYSFWTSLRNIVEVVVANYVCGPGCAAAVGAYQGYQQGGMVGAVTGGFTAYFGASYPLTDSTGNTINWGNVATVASVNAAAGCINASAAGGNCGRGALAGATGTVGAAYGFMGSVIAGCASGRIAGGSCRDGAIHTIGTYAVSWAASGAFQYILDSASAPQSSGDSKSSSEFSVGDKRFIMKGGTEAEQAQAEKDLRGIFGTPRGAEMLSTLQSRRFLWFFRVSFTVDLTVVNNAYAYPNGDAIYVDPKFHPYIETTAGYIAATTQRIMAHELGHAVFGTRDDGLFRMNNVRENENPVMNALGQPSRTSY